jgi:hypothetical protein
MALTTHCHLAPRIKKDWSYTWAPAVGVNDLLYGELCLWSAGCVCQGGAVAIQTPTRWILIVHSVTAPPLVLLPNIIVPPLRLMALLFPQRKIRCSLKFVMAGLLLLFFKWHNPNLRNLKLRNSVDVCTIGLSTKACLISFSLLD